MPYNAKRRDEKRAMNTLRRMVGDDIRAADLDGADPATIVDFLHGRKYALHGTADSWFEVSDPYKTSPLVNPYWEAGGRERDNFPGSGDQHINDDGDKNKNDKGDSDPMAKTDAINKALKDVSKKDVGIQYMVRVRIPDGKDPEDIKSALGPEAKYDGKSVFVIVDEFSDATSLQSKWPGAIVETMKGEVQ